ncbi:SpaH/EbpB family LPXTG-anchored major pilin [Brevibacterium sp. 50QC2O2]|uniref:SpaH/EbpB family LPXTG-anchored major pilin n=1 Tax=Brevibacterium sp. 50QC2O2 TaxID=2968459 RepID=UPI00211BA593|nr:SpaH/EbpB family LPXTG-anchored major pilin [Brevibacterium sp. 50QC2O2]MCQ9389918.1 SpaH/EbpB family LPXTG-anchored major pilin [Brevibacterium sp. 50QC2O2]
MGNSKFGLWQRLTVIAAASALSVAGLSGAANAVEVTGVGNIDSTAKGSITLHKSDSENPGGAGDGSKITDTDALGNPIEGIGFTLYKVNGVDLTTDAGWTEASQAKAGNYTGAALTTVGEKTTNAAGEIDWSNLDLGLYKVVESNSDAVTAKAADFLVTLPLPQGKGGWLYDVNVYPKNTVKEGTPVKEVNDPSNVVIGSDVTWDIKAPVNAKGKKIANFSIGDDLDSRLGYKSATVDGFTAGTDYTVKVDGQKVTIEFTATGVAKLKPAQVVTAHITTTVKDQGDGTIENKAIVYTNDPKHETGTETNEPTTNWGSLDLTKYAKDDESKFLAGAEFDVKHGDKVVGHLKTDANGKAGITLWVGNDDDTTEDYTLVETKAPAGYVLDSTPINVTVKANDTAHAAIAKVANTQSGHPELPLTGANGKLLATIAGIALLLIAAGAGIVAANRRKTNA